MAGQAKNKLPLSQLPNEIERQRLIDEQKNAGQYQIDENPDDYLDPPELDDDEKQLFSIADELDTLDAGAVVRVYQVVKNGRNQYLFQPDYSDDLLGDIMKTCQEHYGRGEYKIQARTANGQLKLNKIISIGDAPHKKTEAVLVAPQTSQPDLLGIQMQIMQQSKADMVNMFTMMQNAQAETIKALAGREPPKSESFSVKDILTMLPMLKELIGGGGDKGGLDTLLKGIELGKDMAGDGGGDSFATLAKSALGSVSDIVKNMPQQPAAPQPVQRVPVQQHQALPPQHQPQPAQPEPPAQAQGLDDLSALVRVLRIAAEREGDPAVYAEILADMLGDDQAADLCSDPANMALIVGHYPELAPHGVFLEAVRVKTLIFFGLLDDDGGATVDETAKAVTNAAPIVETPTSGTTTDQD